jgi:hypothetical protein
MANYDEPLDATTLKYLKAYKAKKAQEQKEEEEYYKQFEKEAEEVCNKYNLQSTNDDLYRSKQIDNDVEEPTNDLVNKDVSSLEVANLIGKYEDIYKKTINLPMDRSGYLNFRLSKKAFQALQDKQEKLLETISASREQTEKLDALFDKISDILDDEELEAKLTKFKDGATKASAPAPAPTPTPTYYDPFKACITITHKKAPKESTNYDQYTAPITIKKKAPEQWDNEKLLEEYYNEKQLKEAEWTKVKTLTKQLEDMKKQMEDYNKYKMFYIKNNGTDTAETTNDRLKLFMSSNYEITTNHKDRIKTSTIYKEYSTISQMDIKIFISKCKDLGMEVIKASGYNVFTCIKAKTAI